MELTNEEIERQANRLLEQAKRYSGLVSDIITNLGNIDDIVKSTGNGALTRSIGSLEQEYITINWKTQAQYNNLADEMLKYVGKSGANVQEASQNIENISSELGNINDNLNSI